MAIRLRCLVALDPTLHPQSHSHHSHYHSHPAVSFRDRFPCLVSYSYFPLSVPFVCLASFSLALLVL
ncbi:hypothetical protein BBK36DRAFT_107662 [Trichoderma citrinoviride]|uniref:Uncharacterized protein n=1 Tax=Trichoderma citrinoviride TaxID=58853 RepID=A0A2T4BH88_9HYPO|nr:hypothetical protein BBK36DRAFT_107662 [Trichoderma citrinoviride]PTB68683.1 hypothetical protein BBK36DRAFT_107662 [Trichoderma citrinoviride]